MWWLDTWYSNGNFHKLLFSFSLCGTTNNYIHILNTSVHYHAFWIQNLAPTSAFATQDNNPRAHVSVFFAFVH